MRKSTFWRCGTNFTQVYLKRRIHLTNCDECVNYVYDEDYDCYTCLVNLDEDEMFRFLQGANYDCPYYDRDDEYLLARKQ
ncbi:MAG: hypothetical protein K2N06_11455 [Oscillospiraceae bacterium]|nr:hypothetical protein [Oscillospiraceae bacterium]